MTNQRFLWFCLCAVLGACDGVDPTEDPDSGPAPDAGPSDRAWPTLRSTTPATGDVGVARDAGVVLRFSEPMARDRGTLRITPGGAAVTARMGEWDAAGSTLVIRPVEPWPSGTVTLTLEADFADLSGNVLEETSITFETVDDVRPRVVETTPAEGATGLSARITEIVVRFDEPMRTTEGTIDVLGGAATLEAPSWSPDATTVTFGVADLEYDRDYTVVLRGFVDANGNRFDGMPYLGDGIIDFSTGPDEDSPRVVRSEPMEGQVDVDPRALEVVLVTFDEAMDTTQRTVTLSDGTTTATLEGTWGGSGRILRVDVAGRLGFERSYALDLGALRDRAGNAVDPAPYLVDGRLDFSVGLDDFTPFVRSSSPSEGELDVSYTDTTEIVVTFSEAMDTTVTTATLAGGAAPVEVTGTWTGAAEIVFALSGSLSANRAVSLDLRGMRDTSGNALDATHPYLGDGRLDFTTSAPTGEGCIDPLTVAEARTVGAGYEWTIGSLQGSVRDGGTAFCDSNGTTASGTDVLVRFDKVSGRVGEGGRYLRIVLDGSTSTTTGTTPYDLAVMTGTTCDPSAVPTQCRSNQAFQQLDLDLDAGPVWIWLSRTTVSSTAATVLLTVEEVDPPRIEGDSCANPYTDASAIYTPPTAPSTVHRFSIPQNALRSVDIGPYSNVASNEFSCDTTLGHGIDGVVRFDKPDDASVLRVSARRTAGTDTLNVEVFGACDVRTGSPARYGCQTGVSTTAQQMLVDAPAGPVYVWFSDTTTTVSRSSSAWQYNAGVDIDIEVIPDVQAGEICSRALTANVGMNAVSGASDQRLNVPGCFGATSPVEWYRIRTTEDVLIVQANAAAGLALFDPNDSRELSCTADGSARALTRVLPAGSDVCLAVEMGRGVTSFTVTEQDYAGLGSRPPVDLGILRPYNATASAEESVTSDYWMVVNRDTLVMRHNFSAAMDVSRAGGDRAARRGTDDGISSSVLGRTAVAVGDAIFSFSSTTTATTSRVHRLWDGRSALWSPVLWDLSPSYVTQAIQAAAPDGDSDILYVTDGSTTTSRPTFYRISTVARSTPLLVGQSLRLSGVRGMVVDDRFIYVSATVDTVRGIYRVPRTDVTAEPEALALSTSFSTSTTQATAMALDRLVAPRYLYVRNANGDVEVVIDPAGSPFYLGPVIDRGQSGDWAMTVDPSSGQMYLFETESTSTGAWLRYDP